MIVDTSALVAIIKREDDADRFEHAIRQAEGISMSLANWLETAIVVDNSTRASDRQRLEELLTTFEIDLVPVTADHAALERAAYRAFGKGSHPAGLNFGDCFVYALAKSEGRALLFKGNDFSRTDITVAA